MTPGPDILVRVADLRLGSYASAMAAYSASGLIRPCKLTLWLVRDFCPGIDISMVRETKISRDPCMVADLRWGGRLACALEVSVRSPMDRKSYTTRTILFATEV